MKDSKKEFNKNLLWFSITSAFKDYVVHEPMVSLGNSFELPRLIRQLGWRVIYACTDGPVSLSRELRILNGFIRYILRMRKHHGDMFVVKYLKSCHLAVQKSIGLDLIKGPRDLEPDLPLPRYSSSRLPRFIPLSDRRAIKAGNSFRIRYWLTLFGLYRILKVPGVFKLNTITDPFSGKDIVLKRVCEDLRWYTLRNSHRFNKTILEREYGVLPIEKSSPSFQSSWKGTISDPKRLKSLGLDLAIETFLRSIGQSKLLLAFNRLKDLKYAPHRDASKDVYGLMGQLAIKEEAAGKIRVFALVDVWTQSCLKPLHEMLFSFLKSLPNDGTFDQTASVKRAAEKAKKANCSFGYDLSAATDRLPIALQVEILSALIGDEGASAWRSLLVDREYRFAKNAKLPDDTFKYAVGQPMGALSSWAMLAVTHHFIVQLAWQLEKSRVQDPHISETEFGRKWVENPLDDWFEDYELLGDDIVIFNPGVARFYLMIMSDLGVGINLSKSVVAKVNSFEFAKTSFYKGTNVSGVSWKMFISQNNNMGRVNILYQLLQKYDLKHPLRYIKRVLQKNIIEQGAIKFNLLALLTMFCSSKRLSFEDLLKTMMEPMDKPRRNILRDAQLFINEGYASLLICALLKGLPLPLRSDRIIERVFESDVDWFNISLLNRITKIKQKLGDSEGMLKRFVGLMVEEMVPGFIPEGHKEIFFEDILTLDDFDEKEITPEMRDLYYFIWDWVVRLFGDLQFYETGSVDKTVSTLQDLILVNEKFDRLVEVLDLITRASNKLEGLTVSRVTKDSPLKTLRFLKDVDKLRNEIVKREKSKWWVDRSEERFVEETTSQLNLERDLRIRYL